MHFLLFEEFYCTVRRKLFSLLMLIIFFQNTYTSVSMFTTNLQCSTKEGTKPTIYTAGENLVLSVLIQMTASNNNEFASVRAI